MRAVLSADQLRRDAEARAGSADASFQNAGDAQRLGDLADIFVLALKREGGGTRNHLQSNYLCERVDDLLRETIRKIFVFRVAAAISEGQHRNRRRALLGRGWLCQR